MQTDDVSPTTDATTRAHFLLCGLVTLETVVCLAVPVVVSAFGLAITLASLRTPYAVLALGYPGHPLQLSVFGLAGFAGTVRLLHLLWNRPELDSRPRLTLAGVACGFVAAILYVVVFGTHRGPGGVWPNLLLAYAPMACALHLVFMNRRALFPGTAAPAGAAPM